MRFCDARSLLEFNRKFSFFFFNDKKKEDDDNDCNQMRLKA